MVDLFQISSLGFRIFRCPLLSAGTSINQKRTIMQNKPNSRKAKNALTAVYTMTNNNEQRTANYSKQTQSNPTRGEPVESICSELVESILSASSGIRVNLWLILILTYYDTRP